MKQLQKSDLKEGEIYKMNNNSRSYIFKATNNLKTVINVTSYNMFFKIGIFNDSNGQFFESTPEEKHWLETCIKADQFVSYEKAMKTFIPEYVECINPRSWEQTIKENGGNLIFKSNFKSTCNNQIKDVYNSNLIHFKPSTKEAYDAQFVVKEPEFVLPKKWYLELKSEFAQTICDYVIKIKPHYHNEWKPINILRNKYISNNTNFGPLLSSNSIYGTEITYEQFKQYVLKENTTVTEEPKVVLEEPKYDILVSEEGKYIGVQCPEGGVYKIGDKITVFDKYSPNKGKVFTIHRFRWTNDKSKICAITELHTPNGIGLDKIELYVEPKVKQELSLLEQAKLKYPIGTKFKVACQPHVICTVLNHNTYYFQTSEICNLYVEEQNYGVNGATVYYKGKWAEIVDDFVLPEKWCVEVNQEIRNRLNYVDIIGYHHSIRVNQYNKWSNKIKEGFTEITFEQFKKYVLKDE